jgi:hypothetical protein
MLEKLCSPLHCLHKCGMISMVKLERVTNQRVKLMSYKGKLPFYVFMLFKLSFISFSICIAFGKPLDKCFSNGDESVHMLFMFLLLGYVLLILNRKFFCPEK